MSDTLIHESFGVHEDGAPGSSTGMRDVLVRTTIRLLQERAFHELSFRDVVAHSGVPMEWATREFATWDDLILATIHTWNLERMRPIQHVAAQHGAVAHLRVVVAGNAQDPGLMRLLAAMTPIAGTPGHPMASVLQRQWVRFHAMVQRALMHDIEVGREPSTMDPARGAEQLIAVYEGLQLQSMLRPHMDVVEAYDRAVTRLREGWSVEYRQPVWDI